MGSDWPSQVPRFCCQYGVRCHVWQGTLTPAGELALWNGSGWDNYACAYPVNKAARELLAIADRPSRGGR